MKRQWGKGPARRAKRDSNLWATTLPIVRRAKGVLLKVLAKRVGVTEGYVSQLEYGQEPSLHVAHKIAKFFNTTVDALWPSVLEANP